MTFEEEFPSLQKYIFAKEIEGSNKFWQEIIQEHCLDKQKVREALIELKQCGCDEGCGCSFSESVEDTIKELRLDDE